MTSTAMAIATTEALTDIKDADGSLEDIIRIAMRATKNHWMCTDENERFLSALAAVMNKYGLDSPEYARIEWEVKELDKLGRVMSAARSGDSRSLIEYALHEEDNSEIDQYTPIGLMGIWRSLDDTGSA